MAAKRQRKSRKKATRTLPGGFTRWPDFTVSGDPALVALRDALRDLLQMYDIETGRIPRPTSGYSWPEIARLEQIRSLVARKE